VWNAISTLTRDGQAAASCVQVATESEDACPSGTTDGNERLTSVCLGLLFNPEHGSAAGLGVLGAAAVGAAAAGAYGYADPCLRQQSLLLSECRIKMEHERVRIGSKLRDDEGHLLRHQPCDEGHVPG